MDFFVAPPTVTSKTQVLVDFRFGTEL